MQQDQPPRNRAERRAQAHKRGPKSPRVPALLRPRNQNVPHAQDTGTGAPSAESDSDMAQESAVADTPPADRKPAVSHHKGAGKQQRVREGLVALYGLAGFVVSRADQIDGQIIAGSGEACADAWLNAGKSDPRIMRALELITVSGPYVPLILVHVQVANAILERHNASPLALFQQVEQAPQQQAQQQARPEPAPLPYQPAGPNAPTEAPAGPPQYAEQLLVIPDEGLPADIDVAIRQAARQTGRPYEELRQEALVQLAQLRMQQNGRMQQPGALGATIARE